MTEEPTKKTKYILRDFSNDLTLWFDTVDAVAGYLTKERIVDPDDYSCYELSKEIQFKVVPV